MTKTTQTPELTLYGNGSATVFPFTFSALEASHVKLYSVGEARTLTPVGESDYEITLLDNGSGGSCVMVTPPASDTEFLLRRETPYDQLVSVSRVNSYDPKVIERVWDKLTLLAQELYLMSSRALKVDREIDPVILGDQEVAVWDAASQSFIPGPNLSQISAAVGAAATATAAAERAETVADILEAITSSAVLGFEFGPWVGDGVTITFALPGTVTGTSQVALYLDGVAQIGGAFSVAGNLLTFAIAPKPGETAFGRVLVNSSVATAAADAILLQSGETVQDYANRGTSFAARSDFVAALNWPWAVGAIVSDGVVQYEYLGTGTAISDAPGWVPFANTTPNHWATNTTPGTTDMTTAIQAAVEYGPVCNVHLLAQTYRISNTITVSSRIDNGQVEGAAFTGVHPNVSLILNVNPSVDWLHFQKGFGNDLGWLAPKIKNIGVIGSNVTTANSGAGIRFTRCLNGLVDNVYSDGPTNHLSFVGSGQMRVENCIMMNVRRVAGQNAQSCFSFTSNPAAPGASPRCFGNYISNCEVYGGETVNRMFDLRSTDGLYVSNCHFNNAATRVYVHPDGLVVGNDTVKQVFFSNIYWDGNGAVVDGVYIKADLAGTDAEISGLYFTNNFFRWGDGSVFKVADGAGELDGLGSIKQVQFSSCHFRNFSKRYINTASIHYAMATLLSEFKVTGCFFEDGPNPSDLSDNINAIAIAGRNVQITGNSFVGDWEDAGEAVILVPADSENTIINSNIFDVARTNPVSINLAAVNARSWGNIWNANAPKVVEVVEEGTTADGYFIRYSDGRQECEKTVVFAAAPIATAIGSIFRTASGLVMGNMAKAFSAEPIFLPSVKTNGPSVYLTWAAGGSSTAMPNYNVNNAITIASADITIRVRAIGRSV